MEYGRATNDDELVAIQRLRYDVYVDEKGWFKETADHAGRRLVDPEDANSWNFFARDGDEIVGALRVTWGGDGFSEHQVEMYELAPFLAEVPAQTMSVGERVILRPAYRGTPVARELMLSVEATQAEHGVGLVFGCCEPHLFNLYVTMGQRPYASHNINDDEVGYVIPLVVALPHGHPKPVVDHPAIERILQGQGRATSAALIGADGYAKLVKHHLDELADLDLTPFVGMTDDETSRCTARSSLIECDNGDTLLRRGGEANNMFVVLDGTLEVRDGDRAVGRLQAGDLFGEMAFLLDRPRALDVIVTSPEARVLSLSGGALKEMMAEDPAAASTLLLNISKMLCARLTDANHS